MADLLDGEVRYYPKQPGSDLEITNVRIISKGSVYSTNYIANIGQSQTESKERKPWELLLDNSSCHVSDAVSEGSD
ncbi:hypothetical protein GCM10020331_024030 [Ectobacillus funiculus]